MARLRTIACALLCVGWSRAFPAACPFDSAAWEPLRRSQREEALAEARPAAMELPCFDAYVRRLASAGGEQYVTRALAALREYARAHEGLPLAAFSAFVDASGLAGDTTARLEIVGIWERYNGSFREKLAAYQDRGMYPAADSLCETLHGLGALDVYDLLRWTRVKGVLNDHAGAARVFCRIAAREPNLVRSVRSQLVHQLAEVEPEEQRAVLTRFSRCRLAGGGVDSAAHLQWLAIACGRFGLYREEVDALIAMDAEEHLVGRRLLAVAEGRFRHRLYDRVTRPAAEAFARLERPGERTRAAVLAYQAYMQRERIDSALVWFDRAGLRDPRSRADAAVLYQLAGLTGKADSVLALIPPSPARDTLAIRQHIFVGKRERAREFADSLRMVSHWRGREEEMALWRLRTAVFAGEIVEAKLILDSTEISPSRPYAREVLDYRYGLKRLGPNPSAFAFWGELESAAYTGDLDSAAARADLSPFSAETRRFLAATLARKLLGERAPETALRVLDQVPEEELTPRLKYHRAEALFLVGRIDRARSILEDLIVNDPGDIYSSKARIYLMQMNRETSM